MEDPGGVPLDRLLGQPLNVAFSLRLAISLASAIGQMHQRGIIHKDIKPAHVLVNSDPVALSSTICNGSIRQPSMCSRIC
jgi:serine/threonine protein kinase